MKRERSWVALVVVVFGLASLAGAGSAPAAEPVAPAYGIEVEIAPDPEQGGIYEARAVVTDLTTEEVLSAPKVRFLRGPEGRGQIRTGTQDGLSVYMEVEVDELGESATYRAEIRRGETLLSSHKVEVRLGGREAEQ